VTQAAPSKVTPVGPIGAAVTGVDLSGSLPRAALDDLMRSAARYGVLVFPDQHLTEAGQLAFTRALGASDITHLTSAIGAAFARPGKAPFHVGADPDVMYFTDGPDFSDTGFADDGRGFGCLHADLSYRAEPLQYTLLSALAVTEVGGETEFVDTVAALADLEPDRARALAGRTAEHVRTEYRTGTVHRAVHPVVVRNPHVAVDGLYLNRSFTRSVDGLDADALEALLAHIEGHPARYRHRWAVGDIVMWDNLRVLHRRCAYPPGRNRIMRRTQARRVVPAAPPG